MKYDFDELVERRGTDSLKYDFAKERGLPDGLIPMWVADMDFRAPPCVIEAVERAARHGIYGYTEAKEDYFDAVAGWFRSGFGYSPEPEWLTKTPGVVFALALAVRAFTEPGDAGIKQRPVYYPFSEVVAANRRKLVNSPLIRENGGYIIDFDDFERRIVESSAKLFLLCSPHNPVGRVWTRAELEKMGEICLKHGVIVVSDEIHCDFTFPGNTHTVFASISPELAAISVICTAPSKTFNLAGLQNSNIFISDPELRRRFRSELDSAGYSQTNAIGLAACRAAYTGGREWLDELKEYLRGNFSFLRTFLAQNLPEVVFTEPEGTYLAWLDFSAFGLSGDELDGLIVNRAGLWLDTGTMFGPEGEGFQRMNVACPRATLSAALDRLARFPLL
jgi:cystathionine beta-lyase